MRRYINVVLITLNLRKNSCLGIVKLLLYTDLIYVFVMTCNKVATREWNGVNT